MSQWSAFPLLHRALTAPSASPAFSDARVKRVHEAIEKFFEAQAAGQIENARLNDYKDILNHAFERAWARLPERPANFYHDPSITEDIKEHASAYNYPTLSNWKTVDKRLKPLPDHPMIVAGRALVAELKPLVDAYAFLKEHAVKRTVKTAEERHAERYAVPVSSSKAVTVVRGLLEQVMDEAYRDLRDAYMRQYRTEFETFQSRLEEVDDAPEKLPQFKDRARVRYLGPQHVFQLGSGPHPFVDSAAVHRMLEVFSLGTRPNGQYGYVAKPGAEALLDLTAQRDADDVRKLFVSKNLKKLVAILEGKELHGRHLQQAEVVGHSVQLDRFEGRFRFVFDDTSSFEVKNSVVHAINESGTRYRRFPLIFLKVRLPNGKALTQPSEQSMNEKFATAPRAEPASLTGAPTMASSEALVRPRRPKM